jgi:ABC-type sugar transport system ATPase subunit
MACVVLRDVKNQILRGISLTVRDGEFLVLVGPSGAGKSTLLHSIAGLIPYTGNILFDNHPIDALDPHERDVGVVFQDLFLFPHLSVEANLVLGMKRHSLKKKAETGRAKEFLNRFGLQKLARRRPAELSGGEKQRVALARAVAGSPRLLLLDEPLSSLDVPAARGLRRELLRFQKELKITTLLVTHNMEEAAEMGDRIGVIGNGVLVSECMPHELRAAKEYLEETGRDRILINDKDEFTFSFSATISEALVRSRGNRVQEGSIPVHKKK